jgi:hypothetical protein
MRYNNAAPGGSQPPFTTVRCERGETKLRTRAGTRGARYGVVPVSVVDDLQAAQGRVLGRRGQ